MSDPVMELFHRCWGQCTDSPSYDKEAWKKLQRLLEQSGGAELADLRGRIEKAQAHVASMLEHLDIGIGASTTSKRAVREHTKNILAALKGPA